MDLREINRQGAKRYFSDKGIYKNPYPVGSLEHDEFERGWMQSLKKDEGKLVGTSSLPSASPVKPQNVPSAAETQAKLYRSRKG